MKPAPFDYYAPSSIDEAIGLLGSVDDPKILAGGQSLMPLLSMRLAQPASIIDLNRIEGMSYVRREDGHLVVGAMTRQRTLELDESAADAVPVLRDILSHVGHVTIRNRGTVGGSMAHADPAAELPAVAVGLDATMVVAGPTGTRTIPASEFFVTYLTTALGPDEVLVEVRFPSTPAGTGHAFEELARRHGDFALGAVLALVRLDGGGRVAAATLAVAGANPVPLRIAAAEAALVGRAPDADAIAAAAAAVKAAVSPLSDVHAPADYRREIIGVLARRALERAVARAKG